MAVDCCPAIMQCHSVLGAPVQVFVMSRQHSRRRCKIALICKVVNAQAAVYHLLSRSLQLSSTIFSSDDLDQL